VSAQLLLARGARAQLAELRRQLVADPPAGDGRGLLADLLAGLGAAVAEAVLLVGPPTRPPLPCPQGHPHAEPSP